MSNDNAGATGWWLICRGADWRTSVPMADVPVSTNSEALDGNCGYTYFPAVALAWVKDGVLPCEQTPARACGITLREALEGWRDYIVKWQGDNTWRSIEVLRGSAYGPWRDSRADLARVTAAIAALDAQEKEAGR